MTPVLRGRSRLYSAAPLVLVIAAVPMAVWFALGRRQARQQAAQLMTQAALDGRQVAERMAGRLRERLQALRDIEMQRPYYHYQALYHDPRGAAEGINLLPSPLASGTNDPLVAVYFQIDPAGHLSMPAFSEASLALASPASRERLEPLVEAYRKSAPRLAGLLPDLRAREAAASVRPGPPPAAPGRTSELPPAHLLDPQQTALLSRDAFEKNSQAAGLAAATASPAPADRRKRGAAAPGNPADTITVEVSWLFWRTALFRGRPAIFALRQVVTPAGDWLQGFQLDTNRLEGELQGVSPLRVTLVHKDPGAGALAAPVEIGGSSWWVVADGAPLFAAARAEGLRVEERFLRSFLLALLTVSLAAGLLLYQIRAAERLARERSRFAAAAAHELRTPLAGLRLYGEMLGEQLGDPAQAAGYGRRIADEAARLSRVVGNILEFTRLERGALRVNPRPDDFAAVIREGAARFAPALEAEGAALALDIPETLPLAFDRDALFEILQNLLDNAEKYSRGASDRTISVIARPFAAGAELEVRDRGPGIPPADRQRVLAPFTRLAREGAPAGLGLGLALVHALAHAHGGQLRIENHPEGGARITVMLPGAAAA